MKLAQKIFAIEFAWIIAASILSFPLALIPMACIDLIIEDYDQFIERINDQVILLYLVLVVVCFIGILLMRFTSSAIKIIIESKEEDKEDKEEE
jgi:hypothetical protein